MCIIAQLTIPCHFRVAARDEAGAVAGASRFLLCSKLFEVKVLHDHKRNQITNRAQMSLQAGAGGVAGGGRVLPGCPNVSDIFMSSCKRFFCLLRLLLLLLLPLQLCVLSKFVVRAECAVCV